MALDQIKRTEAKPEADAPIFIPKLKKLEEILLKK